MDEQGFIRFLHRSRPKSPDTVKAYLSDIRLFEAFLAERGVDFPHVTDALMSEFLEHMRQKPNPRFRKSGLSIATRNRRVVAIRKYCQYLKSIGILQHDPTQGIECPNPGNDDCKAADEPTLDALLAGIDVLRDKAIIRLFLSSGLRISELHQLNRDSWEACESADGNIECGSVEVVGKGSKRRTVFFDVRTLELIAEYLQTRTDSDPALFISERKRRLSKRAIQDLLEFWCKKLALPRLHPHMLRHSYATAYANADMPSMTLKHLMGHNDLRTTNRYYRLEYRTLATQYFAATEIVKQLRAQQ